MHAGITVLMTVFGFGCYTHDMIYSIIHIHKNRYESEINQILTFGNQEFICLQNNYFTSTTKLCSVHMLLSDDSVSHYINIILLQKGH